MTVTIGAQALGRAWRRMMVRARQALELRHLDIGAGEQADDRGAGHPHHMGDDDQGERQGGQHAAPDALAEGRLVVDVGKRRKLRNEVEEAIDAAGQPLRQALRKLRADEGIAGDDDEGQHVGDEEFGEGDGGERDGIDRPVEEAVAVEGGGDAERQRQRHGDEGGHHREEQRVEEARLDDRGDGAPVADAAGEGLAELAAGDLADPFDVALDRRAIEADLPLEGGDGFRASPTGRGSPWRNRRAASRPPRR